MHFGIYVINSQVTPSHYCTGVNGVIATLPAAALFAPAALTAGLTGAFVFVAVCGPAGALTVGPTSVCGLRTAPPSVNPPGDI